ncbi:MAG: hypothetical protein KBD63_01235 [Bacteriovoracaceae bacterium]|nr:hypothetical protein [Bacteriovoracaceae bacterium]
MSEQSTRRNFLKGLLGLVIAGAVFKAGRAIAAAGQKLVATKELFKSFKYEAVASDASKKAGKLCSACMHYQKETFDAALGKAKCKMLKKGGETAYVDPNGTCSLFVKKPA